MITIISGTNRQPSLTSKFTGLYLERLKRHETAFKVLNLQDIPADFLFHNVYDQHLKPPAVELYQAEYFIPAKKFIFIFPEYNGSIPGVLKLMIDGLDPALAFKGKKASMIGIATGRAGNLRGMDHLTSILMHMQVQVLPYLLPVSRVQAEFEDDHLKESTLKLVDNHILRTLEF